jgi:hypothetical protein
LRRASRIKPAPTPTGAPRPHGPEAGSLAWQQEVRQELDDAASAAAARLQAGSSAEDPFDRR